MCALSAAGTLRWLCLLPMTVSAADGLPAWAPALISLERRSADPATATAGTTAIAVMPRLLISILPAPDNGEILQAVQKGAARPVRLLAHDAPSGFALLEPVDAGTAFTVLPLPEKDAPPAPGDALLLASAAAMADPAATAARVAGRERLRAGVLMDTPWLRVQLPQGQHPWGTPLLTPEGKTAGLLARGSKEIPDAGLVLPASVLRHFLAQWNATRGLTRSRLGCSLDPATGIPRVERCTIGLPANLAGVEPGDILLRIGSTPLHDASDTVEACFFLAVDQPVEFTLLRGTEIKKYTVTPVSAAGR